MYITTIYDIKKDYNMMLDSSLVDCFQEIEMDQEVLSDMIEVIECDKKLNKNEIHCNNHNINGGIKRYVKSVKYNKNINSNKYKSANSSTKNDRSQYRKPCSVKKHYNRNI